MSAPLLATRLDCGLPGRGTLCRGEKSINSCKSISAPQQGSETLDRLTLSSSPPSLHRQGEGGGQAVTWELRVSPGPPLRLPAGPSSGSSALRAIICVHPFVGTTAVAVGQAGWRGAPWTRHPRSRWGSQAILAGCTRGANACAAGVVPAGAAQLGAKCKLFYSAQRSSVQVLPRNPGFQRRVDACAFAAKRSCSGSLSF